MSSISKFNNQLKDFIKDLQLLDINNGENLNDSLYYLKFNSKLGIKLFREYLLDDGIKRLMIFDQNDDFFLNQDCNYYNKSDNITENMILEIKEKWICLDNNSKQKIWNYLKVLIYFSDQDMGVNTIDYNKNLKREYLKSRVVIQ
jgi:hypothetical protein